MTSLLRRNHNNYGRSYGATKTFDREIGESKACGGSVSATHGRFGSGHRGTRNMILFLKIKNKFH